LAQVVTGGQRETRSHTSSVVSSGIETVGFSWCSLQSAVMSVAYSCKLMQE